jgi:predicted anti-sigma-YlaC factor YlaD
VHIEHVEFQLPEYLDGTLAGSLREGIEEHLRHCSACRRTLEELQQTMAMLDRKRTSGPSEAYFATLLPRVRQRLERDESRNPFGAPFVLRFALPVAAAAIALFVLLSLPFPSAETQVAHNPLQAVMHGSTADELVDVVLDMMPLQPLSTPTVEGETSSLLGARILRGDHMLASAFQESPAEGLSFDGGMPDGLEQLSDADLEVLVQQLGERTTL